MAAEVQISDASECTVDNILDHLSRGAARLLLLADRWLHRLRHGCTRYGSGYALPFPITWSPAFVIGSESAASVSSMMCFFLLVF